MRKFEFFILCCQLLCAISVFGQGTKQSSAIEKIIVCTDRSVYCVGESIQFSAELLKMTGDSSSLESTVLYCELITPEGYRATGNKFLIKDHQSAGCLTIPKEIVTGYYYFRAYTKFMRNNGPEAYSYSLLKIINPLKNDVLVTSGTNNLPGYSVVPETGSDNDHTIDISTDKSIYKTRDTVHLKVSRNEPEIGDLKNSSLAVIPFEAGSSAFTIVPQPDIPLVKEQFYSENRGITITGKLLDAQGNVPIGGALVNLSIIGEGRDFMATRTDSAGGFYFSLPYYIGKRDLFICSAKLPGKEPKILVDNEFCTQPVHLPSPPFELSEAEKVTAYQIAANALVQSAFIPDTTFVTEEAEVVEKPFYGTPSEILYLDQYVQLPTLEEYFNELPLMVKVKKRKGEKYFKVYGTQNALDLFDPLVLIDYVAVDDPGKILKVLPQDVARIEIVNEPYVKGSQTYGGIISIISKRGDFAVIDLPSSGIFINYRFLDDNSKCAVIQPADNQLPDTRNTLFWQSHITPEQLTNTGFVFTAGDTHGKYEVVLRSISPSGKISIAETMFIVE